MKKKNELLRELTDLIKDTKAKKIKWEVKCSTTEYNPVEQKPVVMEDNKEWVVDECYVSYHCEYRGQEFLMITYEMIHSCGDKNKTTNLVFMPPLGIRYFDINVLLDYAVEMDQMLAYQVHMLWLVLLELHKNDPDFVSLEVDERQLVIE